MTAAHWLLVVVLTSVLALGSWPGSAVAQIYSWQNTHGTLCFSDRPLESDEPSTFCPTLAPGHTPRMLQPTQAGAAERLFANVPVVGLPPATVRPAAEAVLHSADSHLVLAPDSSRSVPAVQVLGIWRDAAGIVRQGHLGWVPPTVAHLLATQFAQTPLRATIAALVLPAEASPRISIDIWRGAQAGSTPPPSPRQASRADTSAPTREPEPVEQDLLGEARELLDEAY